MKKLLVGPFVIFLNIAASAHSINWYVNDSLYQTTTCENGGDVNLPNTPSKFGYDFSGWEPAKFNFGSLDYTINSESMTYEPDTNTWTATFSYGVLYGESSCNSTAGASSLDVSSVRPTESDTWSENVNCWCHLTGYQPAGSDIIYDSATMLPWVFVGTRQSAEACFGRGTAGCTYYCAYYNRSFGNFGGYMKAILGHIQ